MLPPFGRDPRASHEGGHVGRRNIFRQAPFSLDGMGSLPSPCDSDRIYAQSQRNARARNRNRKCKCVLRGPVRILTLQIEAPSTAPTTTAATCGASWMPAWTVPPPLSVVVMQGVVNRARAGGAGAHGSPSGVPSLHPPSSLRPSLLYKRALKPCRTRRSPTTSAA